MHACYAEFVQELESEFLYRFFLKKFFHVCLNIGGEVLLINVQCQDF